MEIQSYPKGTILKIKTDGKAKNVGDFAPVFIDKDDDKKNCVILFTGNTWRGMPKFEIFHNNSAIIGNKTGGFGFRFATKCEVKEINGEIRGVTSVVEHWVGSIIDYYLI